MLQTFQKYQKNLIVCKTFPYFRGCLFTRHPSFVPMKQPALFRYSPILALSAVLLSPADAFTIQMDYSFDEAASDFFSNSPFAKAALEAAATDVSNALTSTFGAISGSQYTVTGINGSTSATFDWGYNIANPSTGTQITLSNPGIAADTVVIYAGTRTLGGATLGVGGMGGIAVGIDGFGFGSEWEGAVASAETQSNDIFGRGGGPTAYLIEGEITLGSTASYSVSTGLGVGGISFDDDTAWHFNHTTDVESGKFDFYSVAVHEILHSLGIGPSLSWNSLVAGNDWTGSNVIDLYGTGVDLISGGDHVAAGTMSYRISDGVEQEAIMSPSLASGQRKQLTELDLAFMQDIGWETIAIPEPGVWTLAGLGLAAVVFSRRRG